MFGLGGPRMAAEGVELVADLERLAVMGFLEVLDSLPFFVRLLRRLGRRLRNERVDLLLPIDYPGFNMRLSRHARRGGVPVLYYIAPQVWAWHRSRMRELAETADRLAVVLPFEEPLFREAGARVTYVGHPLLDLPPIDELRDTFVERLGLDASRPVLALFPGSRAQEVERHLELFVDAAHRVSERSPVQPVIAASDAVTPKAYAGAPFPRTEDSRALLAHAHAALVKSGTTTLEAALAGVPMVIAYRTHPVSYWLAERLVEVDHIGLANLVAGERVAPEFVQDAATPEALAAALAPLVAGDSPERARALDGLARVRGRLEEGLDGGRTAAVRVGDLAGELLDGHG